MGAVTNLGPISSRRCTPAVPFVDVMNTMMDASLPLTVGEFLEWGNPNEKAAFDYMRSYSPYDNLEQKAYPAILVTTSLNDSQVMYWEPAKYVAKLRTLKTDCNPLLLKCNMGAGHGGASGRYDRLKQTALRICLADEPDWHHEVARETPRTRFHRARYLRADHRRKAMPHAALVRQSARPARARSRLKAALIRARWVKACGKLPRASPLGPVCSAYSPRWLP